MCELQRWLLVLLPNAISSNQPESAVQLIPLPKIPVAHAMRCRFLSLKQLFQSLIEECVVGQHLFPSAKNQFQCVTCLLLHRPSRLLCPVKIDSLDIDSTTLQHSQVPSPEYAHRDELHSVLLTHAKLQSCPARLVRPRTPAENDVLKRDLFRHTCGTHPTLLHQSCATHLEPTSV